MNHFALFLRSTLLMLLLVAASSKAATPLLGETTQYVNCYTNLPLSDAKNFGKTTQQQLQILYQDNPTYQDAFNADAHLLSDGFYGPKTRQWLSYFCAEFAITIDSNHADFIQRISNDLSLAANIEQQYPKWREFIAPSELLNYSIAQISQKLVETNKPQDETTDNSEQDSSATPPPTTAPAQADYYQLEASDLTELANQQALLAALNKLAAKQFESQSTLYNALREQFDQLGLPTLDVEPLIETKTITTPIAAKDQGQSEQKQNSTVTQQSKAQSSDDTPTTTTTTAQTTTTTTQTQSSVQIWQINNDKLQATLHSQNLVSIPKETLKKLQSLTNEVFPSLYLFKMALILEQIEVSNSVGKSIVKKAEKAGAIPLFPDAVTWLAPDNCGCEGSRDLINQADTFYGFYPYWIHPKEGQVLNFSQLDRIGYIGAAIEPTTKGPKLILPSNWNTTVEDSRFIQTAHQYRTAVDLVVTAHSDKDIAAENIFTESLVDQLVASIKQPLNNLLSNHMQPVLSLGFSSVPTIGDGITLDIDLDQYNKAQQAQFINFIKELKAKLNNQSDLSNISAQNDDRYYLNIIIPIEPIINYNKSSDTQDNQKSSSKVSIYNFETLYQLSKYTNLLIMRSGDPTSIDESKQSREQIKLFIQWLTEQSDQEKVDELYRHILPMLVSEDNRQDITLNQLIHLANWSLLGAAFWPMPLDTSNQKIVNNIYFNEDIEKPIEETSQQSGILDKTNLLLNKIMNWVCPQRWLIRLILAGVFSVIFLVLIVSIWYYPWRKLVMSFAFSILCSLAILTLMLSLVADPYFKELQVPISLGFVIFIGIILMCVRTLRKEGDKP